MKIGFFGGGAEALAVLERIVDQPGWEIVFVQPRDTDGLIVTEFARRRDVEIMDFDDINEMHRGLWRCFSRITISEFMMPASRQGRGRRQQSIVGPKGRCSHLP